jgi:hypothetical protein
MPPPQKNYNFINVTPRDFRSYLLIRPNLFQLYNMFFPVKIHTEWYWLIFVKLNAGYSTEIP